MESQISLLKTKALYSEFQNEYKALVNLELNDYIDSELNIDYKIIFEAGVDLELLEFISRLFVRINYLLFRPNKILIGIKNTPESFQEYLAWFIKLFGYLEASDLGDIYSYNSLMKEVFESKFMPYKFQTDNMKFAIENIEVEFR